MFWRFSTFKQPVIRISVTGNAIHTHIVDVNNLKYGMVMGFITSLGCETNNKMIQTI